MHSDCWIVCGLSFGPSFLILSGCLTVTEAPVCLRISKCNPGPTFLIVNQRGHISLTVIDKTAHNQASLISKSRNQAQHLVAELWHCHSQICRLGPRRTFRLATYRRANKRWHQQQFRMAINQFSHFHHKQCQPVSFALLHCPD